MDALRKALEPEEVDKFKEEILVAERAVLYTLGFDLSTEHPYHFLVQELSAMELLTASHKSDSPYRFLMQNTWNFVNDSFRTTVSLQVPPTQIAFAALYLANQLNTAQYGPAGDLEVLMKKKYGPGTTLFNHFKVQKSAIDVVCDQILQLYQDTKLDALGSNSLVASAAARPDASYTNIKPEQPGLVCKR
ncbi:cyclin domain-containing protein, partial [Haematococcus lacustris]